MLDVKQKGDVMCSKKFIIFFLWSISIFVNSQLYAGSGGLDDLYAEELKKTFKLARHPIDDEEYARKVERLKYIEAHKKDPNMHKIRGFINDLAPLEAYFVGEVLEDYYVTLGYLYRRDLEFEKARECDIKLTLSPNK